MYPIKSAMVTLAIVLSFKPQLTTAFNLRLIEEESN